MQLKAETNKYLNKFHEERRQRLALLLDSEEWRPAEVPKELQEAIDDVLAQGQGQRQEADAPVKPKRSGINNKYYYSLKLLCRNQQQFQLFRLQLIYPGRNSLLLVAHS